MVRMGSIDVRWTESIDDHLRLDSRRKVLSVFPYKSVLVGQLHTTIEDGGSKSHKILPNSLLYETIVTLNLLFPQWDTTTQVFLREYKQNFDSDPPFEGPRQRSLEEFSFWRDRLLELHEINKSPPGTWAQLWLDRRNPHQWWTFWIVLLAIIPMTAIGCATSILQSVVAVKALKLQMAAS